MIKRVSMEEWFPIFEVNDEKGRGEFLLDFSETEIARIKLIFNEFDRTQELIKNKLREAGYRW